MTILRTWSPLDGVLGAVAPLALAAASGTALVVDLDPGGPAYPGAASLAAMVEDGPRAGDLRPSRPGVAVLRNGGVEGDAATGLVDALARGWPHLILRLPATPFRPEAAGVVPILPLAPGGQGISALAGGVGDVLGESGASLARTQDEGISADTSRTRTPPAASLAVPNAANVAGRGTWHRGPAVYQRGPWPVDRRIEGVVLPRPRASVIRNLLEGRRPPMSRWVRAWHAVWDIPWP